MWPKKKKPDGPTELDSPIGLKKLKKIADEKAKGKPQHSLKDVENLSEDSLEGPYVPKDCAWYKHRVVLCVFVVAGMFAFSYLAIQLQGGDPEEEPTPYCDEATARIDYGSYQVVAAVQEAPFESVAVRITRDGVDDEELNLTLSAFSPEDALPGNVTPAVTQESLCGSNAFTSTTEGVWSMRCSAAGYGDSLWSVPVTRPTIVCYVEARNASKLAVEVASSASPALCGDPVDLPSLDAACLGLNVTLVSSTAIHRVPTSDSLHLELPAYPTGPLNGSAEFAFVF
ncbi:hypothetical protein DIPPA_33045 [Diplonema papillatum]|nr:hypothetical protein DIPPA_33045 [Diplonema papillatum]